MSGYSNHDTYREEHHHHFDSYYFLRILTWVVFALSAGLMAVTLYRFPLLPGTWKLLAALLLAALIAAMAFFSFRRHRQYQHHRKHIAVTVINCVLSVVMVIGLVAIPGLTSRMNRVFAEPAETETVAINVYALSSEYRAAHPDQFETTEVSTDIQDYREATFIVQSASDQDLQAYAVQQLKEELGTDELETLNETSVLEAVSDFYKGNGNLLILNPLYESIVSETEEYAGFQQDVVVVETIEQEIEKNTADGQNGDGNQSVVSGSQTAETVDPKYRNIKPSGNLIDQPFTLFLAGSDSRDKKLTSKTRTDVDIVLTVNPVTHQMLLVSYPRDSYIANPAAGNEKDKLTHMGIYGIGNSTAALGQWMQTPIERYALVNFDSFVKIVDVLGGVDVDNPYAFDATGNGGHFAEGRIHLDAKSVLPYVRERYNLPNGDFGRNEHEMLVLDAILKKLLSPQILPQAFNILDAMQGMFLTNVATDDIYGFIAEQLQDRADWNIVRYHITGKTGRAITASMPGTNLSVVFPDESQAAFIQDQMQDVLDGKVIRQEDLSGR